jgi:hypothetical protein
MRENCQIQPDSYAAVHNDIKIHGRADVSGHCIRRYNIPPPCPVWANEYRTISGITVTYRIPGQSTDTSAGPIYGKNPNTGYYAPVQPTLDSEDLTNSFGPRAIGLVAIGEWTVNQQSLVNTTNCSIGPASSPWRSIRYYSVSCVPNWKETAENFIRRFPTGQTIKINVEAALAKAAGEAAAAWTSILNSVGVNITFETGLCAIADGPTCITVERGLVPDAPTSCAGVSVHTDTTTGIIDTSPTIYIPNNPYTYGRLVSLFSHEIGHLLGLDDDTCNHTQSVMWLPETQQCPYDLLSGEAGHNTASLTNALPLAKTVYAVPPQGTRLTCPAQ